MLAQVNAIDIQPELRRDMGYIGSMFAIIGAKDGTGEPFAYFARIELVRWVTIACAHKVALEREKATVAL